LFLIEVSASLLPCRSSVKDFSSFLIFAVAAFFCSVSWTSVFLRVARSFSIRATSSSIAYRRIAMSDSAEREEAWRRGSLTLQPAFASSK
jgi:hypothetical protein